jgi:hypothetical protein
MVGSVSSSLNALIAAQSPAGRQALAQSENIVSGRNFAQKQAITTQSINLQAGRGQQLNTEYDYATGADGKRYVQGLRVTSRPVADELAETRNFNISSARNSSSLSDIAAPKLNLAPADELHLFASEQIVSANNANVIGKKLAQINNIYQRNNDIVFNNNPLLSAIA